MNEKKSQTDSGYKRTLSNAHIQLIALGGTIGTGLFQVSFKVCFNILFDFNHW